MTVTVTTKISFDPIGEREEIERFREANNLAEWREEESTISTSFTKIERFFTRCG